MRIAFCIKGLRNGGAEHVAAQLTCVWSRLGHEVVLLSDDNAQEHEYNHVAVAREAVDYTRIGEDELNFLRGKYAFSAVVVNDAFNDGWLPRLLPIMKKMGLKTVVVNHHCPDSWLYSTINSGEVLLDQTYALFDVMVFVDPIWAVWWHYRGFNSFYIPNPVLLKLSRGREVRRLPGDRHTLVWIGRLTDWAKRPELAVDVFAEILKSVPDAKLVMLGTKTEKVERVLRKRLKRRLVLPPPRPVSTQSQDSDQLEFPGFVPDTSGYLRTASLHLLTSLTEVTVPQVVLEAQVAGIPTVAAEQPVLEGAVGVETGKSVKDISALAVRLLQDGEAFDKIASDLTAYADDIKDRVALIEKSWGNILSNLWNEKCLSRMRQANMEQVRTEENVGRLFREFHRAEQYFVLNYLPLIHRYRRLRQRVDIRYLMSRVLSRVTRKWGM